MRGKDLWRDLARTLRRPLDRRLARAKLERFHASPHSLEDVVDAGIDFGTRGHLKIKALQLRSELLALAQAVRDLRPRVILELGTHRGGTLLVWAHLASERAISCDLHIPRYRRDLLAAYPPSDSACRVELLEGNTHSPEFRERVRATLGDDRVDFLFIDGDHSEAGVTADWYDYRGFVRPGGLVAFHDIVENESFGVQRLWARLRNELPFQEFVENPEQASFGIGVVRV